MLLVLQQNPQAVMKHMFLTLELRHNKLSSRTNQQVQLNPPPQVKVPVLPALLKLKLYMGHSSRHPHRTWSDLSCLPVMRQSAPSAMTPGQ